MEIIIKFSSLLRRTIQYNTCYVNLNMQVEFELNKTVFYYIVNRHKKFEKLQDINN